MRRRQNVRASGMRDKVVLIINGLSDTGLQLAQQITAAGGHVAIVDQRAATRPDYARRFRDAIETSGRRCLLLAGQLPGQEQAGREIIKRIVDQFGRLDSFVAFSADGNNELAVAALDHILLDGSVIN
ncbi:MAG: hypothetical protein R6X18_08280 [Chloroflexota bacterium]|jgi:NAD(P)-dependent dehydrogenase (short-subunit alcohol dehydrogenase family)